MTHLALLAAKRRWAEAQQTHTLRGTPAREMQEASRGLAAPESGALQCRPDRRELTGMPTVELIHAEL